MQGPFRAGAYPCLPLSPVPQGVEVGARPGGHCYDLASRTPPDLVFWCPGLLLLGQWPPKEQQVHAQRPRVAHLVHQESTQKATVFFQDFGEEHSSSYQPKGCPSMRGISSCFWALSPLSSSRSFSDVHQPGAVWASGHAQDLTMPAIVYVRVRKRFSRLRAEWKERQVYWDKEMLLAQQDAFLIIRESWSLPWKLAASFYSQRVRERVVGLCWGSEILLILISILFTERQRACWGRLLPYQKRARPVVSVSSRFCVWADTLLLQFYTYLWTSFPTWTVILDLHHMGTTNKCSLYPCCLGRSVDFLMNNAAALPRISLGNNGIGSHRRKVKSKGIAL